MYERASTPIISSDQVIECVSVTHARRHCPMLLSLQVFLLFLCRALIKSVSTLQKTTSSSEVASLDEPSPAGYSTKISMSQIDRRPADALPRARVTARRERNHETSRSSSAVDRRLALPRAPSKNIDCFLKRTSSYPPPPKRTSFVWNKMATAPQLLVIKECFSSQFN